MYHWVLKTRVYLGLRTCKVFLWFVAIVRVRIYDLDFFVFIVLRHWWVLQVLTPRMSPKLRQRPHFAGEIWKHSFISTVRPTVHTNPSRKRSFSKTLLKPEEFENTGFAFYAFFKRRFSKTMARSWWSYDFPNRVLLKHKSNMTGHCCIF